MTLHRPEDIKVSLTETKFSCHGCGSDRVAEEVAYRALPGVTSDARPWPAGTRIGRCLDCGMVVKSLDDRWRESVAQIYQSYVIYHQSKGAEKLSFDEGVERAAPRSVALLRKLFQLAEIPKNGRALDIGTGTGVMLQALSRLRPDLELWAQDLSGHQRKTLETIPGFRGLHVGNVDTIEGKYDLVSLVHVLEHAPEPRAFLAGLRKLLTKTGILVVNIPDAVANPFDILIVDHCSHFTLGHLRAVVESAGFHVIFADNRLLARELVVIASASGAAHDMRTESASLDLERYVRWLKGVHLKANEIAARRPMALFGSTNAGTWAYAEL